MYLQVVFLLEICEAMGQEIEQYLWKQPQVTGSAFHWPKTHKPTPMEWQFWQQALQQATSTGQNLMLPLPLGILDMNTAWDGIIMHWKMLCITKHQKDTHTMACTPDSHEHNYSTG